MLIVANYKNQMVHMIQPKMDGWQYRIIITDDGCQCLSRGKCVDVWDKIFRGDLGRVIELLPIGSDFIVELHSPGVPATSVPTMIAENDPRLRMTVLSIDLWCHQDFTDKTWSEVQAVCEIHGLEAVPTTERCPPRVFSTEEVENLKQQAIDLGIEGWITRVEHQLTLCKIKPTRTIDVVVTDWDLGTNRNAARLGSVRMGVYTDEGLKDLGSCGIGFNDEDRLEYSRNPLTGKVIEVEYDDLAAKGKLKFARFLRVRDDKLPRECSGSQL
ncbi:MAG: hypothetical protein COA69_09605 [Robiginitomaculum sp.]|nr:MAG: hypothetical protein COA69_09605 [Robiginitomaculum sp.]